ncbi:MAG TPA: SRPBCC family protein [Phycisphaerales bacterium]|nr:SRPBCC family protein [Phycisphaerales bacterium]
MPGFSIGVTVLAPPARVFGIAADIPRINSIIPSITRVEVLTPGPTRVGTRWRETRKAGPGSATVELEVTAFDPDRLMTVVGTMAGTRYTSTFAFQPVPDGTRVSLDCSATPTTFLACLMVPLTMLMLPTMSKDMEGDLKALKAAAEKPGQDA